MDDELGVHEEHQENEGVLARELGVTTASFLGLGSILGTGVFVSIGFGASIAGAGIVWAIFIAGLLATCNGLSSAQLAANHPVAGGTYAYGYRFLTPSLGFTAGWMFLCAKSASAAAAGLGFAGYVLHLFDVEPSYLSTIVVAAGALIVMTVLVLSGIRRSALANMVLVLLVILALVAYIVTGFFEGARAAPHAAFILPDDTTTATTDATPASSSFYSIAVASAIMFVAYTGYGRVATLGEEVRTPQTTIPRAIIVTLSISAAVYVLTALASIAAVGVTTFSSIGESSTAPLETVARTIGHEWLAVLLTIGATVAMLSVMLNLILGLSRVFLAMGRQRDMPHQLGQVRRGRSTPSIAVCVSSVVILVIMLIGDFKLAWTFSAFTVLIYYALTNLAAIMLTRDERFLPRGFSIAGLVGCLGLAAFIDRRVLFAGLTLVFIGVIWHIVAQSRTSRKEGMIGT